MRCPVAASAGLLPALALAFLLPATSLAADGAGTGLAFLKVGVGARAVAVGNAVVSHVDDPSALGWNPGALPLLTGTEAELAHQESFGGVRQEYVALTHRMGAQHGLGVSFTGLWTDPLQGYDASGQFSGEFAYSDLGLSVGYGFAPLAGVGVGVAATYLREAIDTHTATGVAWDVGVQAREVLPNTDVGLAVLHLGSDLKYEVQAIRLPVTVQGGISHLVPIGSLGGTVRLAVEMRKTRDENARMLVGTEYEYQHAARVQIGYRPGLDSESLSFGLGVGRGRVRGQYAFVPFENNLGDQHRLALQLMLH